MPDATPHRDPNADAVARQRGLAASHAARRDAELGERDPWWLHCDVDKFMLYLHGVEAERAAAKQHSQE